MTKTRSSGDDIPIPLEKVLARPDVASELFFPIDRASWWEKKRRYFVERGNRRGVPSTIGGVRFQSSAHAEPGTSAVTDCQNDVVRLVRSLALIRKVPDLAEAVLSKDVLLNRQLGRPEGRRAKFGLFIPINGKFRDASDAARKNHHQIRRAIGKAGFTIIRPEGPFESRTGMDGLQKWAEQLRLRKRRKYWWLLLLLLPLLWLPYRDLLNPPTASPINPESPTPFDMPPVETDGLILVLDESPSMDSSFRKIRHEAQRYLNDRRDSPEKRSFIDIIRYSDKPDSVLHALRALDDGVKEQLNAFLEKDVTKEKPPEPPNPVESQTKETPAGSPNPDESQTKLHQAMQKVVEEVDAHNKAIAHKEATPVTALIVTDAVDSTIDTLNKDSALKDRLKKLKVKVYATTPRLLPGADQTKKEGSKEEALAEFCNEHGGRLGPMTPTIGSGQINLTPGSNGKDSGGQTGGGLGGTNPPPEPPIKGSGEQPGGGGARSNSPPAPPRKGSGERSG